MTHLLNHEAVTCNLLAAFLIFFTLESCDYCVKAIWAYYSELC